MVGKASHPLLDAYLPTLDAANPYDLTAEEQDLMQRLAHSFMINERLQRHVSCLLHYGGMYGIYNSNLLFHASVPLNADGSLREVEVMGQSVKGKSLLERV